MEIDMPKAVNWTASDLSQPAGIWGWNDFEHRFLAEGDSWFTLAALPGGNLLQELSLDRSSLIVNTAYPGDTLSHIVDWRDNRDFVNLLSAPGFAYKWDAVLLSAGGNDLVDAALSPNGIVQRPTGTTARVESCINQSSLDAFECYMRANLASVVELRDSPDSPNKGIPIFIHTYDYPTARPAPAKLLGAVGVSGPWLHKAYTHHQVPGEVWASLTDHLMDRLATVLNGLNLPNVTVIDTRGTLDRAVTGDPGNSGDWLNEIHANIGGRKKLARIWADKLNRIP
jgi:hypothetical protein